MFLIFLFFGSLFGIIFNCFKATELLQGRSYILTSKSPAMAGNHLSNLRKMKNFVDLRTTYLPFRLTRLLVKSDVLMAVLYLFHSPPKKKNDLKKF